MNDVDVEIEYTRKLFRSYYTVTISAVFRGAEITATASDPDLKAAQVEANRVFELGVKGVSR